MHDAHRLGFYGREMSSKFTALALVAVLLVPVSAFAEDTGFFAGLDASGGMAYGSSRTTDGGAPFAGGGSAGSGRGFAAWAPDAAAIDSERCVRQYQLV